MIDYGVDLGFEFYVCDFEVYCFFIIMGWDFMGMDVSVICVLFYNQWKLQE